jgi:hypothetical protein
MASVKVSDKQSLFDIAVQSLGSVSAVFELATENDLSITEALTAGQSLGLSEVYSSDVADYFTNKKIKPATAITSTDYNETIAQEGIEFWAIEMDFVVS